MKKIKIKGKDYVEVHERVTYLRENFGDKDNMFGISTKVIEWNKEAKEVIIQAWITDQTGRIVGSGIAHEWQDDPNSFVNATSYVENCETSAIGRALAAFGIGIEDAYASANEVKAAIKKQESKSEKKSQNKTDDLIDQMESNIPEDNKLSNKEEIIMTLCEIFAESTHWTGSMADQKNEMIENINREDTTDMEEFDIKDFALTNQQNKAKLKKYCEPFIKHWQEALPKNEYDELVQFMTYLNKKFEEEAV